MPRLDEAAHRRPDFAEGVRVVLADGQAWELRRPAVFFAPAENDAGYKVVMDLGDPDDAYNDLFTSYREADESADVIRIELGLGRMLLLANYDLDAAQVARLLRFSFEEEGANPLGDRIRREVLDVAFGRDPKRAAGGGGSSPSPPA